MHKVVEECREERLLISWSMAYLINTVKWGPLILVKHTETAPNSSVTSNLKLAMDAKIGKKKSILQESIGYIEFKI